MADLTGVWTYQSFRDERHPCLRCLRGRTHRSTSEQWGRGEDGYSGELPVPALADLAEELGFRQISVSHRVSPLMKLVSRGDTTVVDAYLSPILRRGAWPDR